MKILLQCGLKLTAAQRVYAAFFLYALALALALALGFWAAKAPKT
jgi:hypothetical protein